MKLSVPGVFLTIWLHSTFGTNLKLGVGGGGGGGGYIIFSSELLA